MQQETGTAMTIFNATFAKERRNPTRIPTMPNL